MGLYWYYFFVLLPIKNLELLLWASLSFKTISIKILPVIIKHLKQISSPSSMIKELYVRRTICEGAGGHIAATVCLQLENDNNNKWNISPDTSYMIIQFYTVYNNPDKPWLCNYRPQGLYKATRRTVWSEYLISNNNWDGFIYDIARNCDCN